MAILFFASAAYSQSGTQAVDTIEEATTAPADEDYESTDHQEVEKPGYYSDTLQQNFRSVVYDSVESINNDKGFYYKRYLDSLMRASIVEKPKDIDLRFDFFNSIFGVIFWIVAIGLFGYLVYRLFLSNSAIFSRNRKNISSEIDMASQEDAGDPEALLRNAIKNGNHRLAVRYLYLQVLSKLAEKRLIEINSNKTNYEYVLEVRKHKFANEFASLTLQYEYVWYGEYPIDERLFEQIQGGFSQFNKNLTR